jgi:hypothetical protein
VITTRTSPQAGDQQEPAKLRNTLLGGAGLITNGLGRPASGPRGGSLVLPPRPGWRDLAGRFLAYPTPSRKHFTNQPGT